MLTVGQLIDHLELEREELEAQCRESTVSFLHNDFQFELVVDHGTHEYVLEIKEDSTKPTSTDANLKYLHCFNRDLLIVTESLGINSGKPIEIVTHNSSCGKVEYCLTPIGSYRIN